MYFNYDTTVTKDLFETIVLTIEEEGGVEVAAVIFNLGYKTFMPHFNFTEDQHWIQSPCTVTQKIFFPDILHMIKLCRNLILDEGLLLPSDYSATFTRKDLVDLFEKDSGELKMVFKITPLNVTCSGSERQRVYLATQLLSQTVAKSFDYLFGKEKFQQAKAVLIINA